MGIDATMDADNSTSAPTPAAANADLLENPQQPSIPQQQMQQPHPHIQQMPMKGQPMHPGMMQPGMAHPPIHPMALKGQKGMGKGFEGKTGVPPMGPNGQPMLPPPGA